MLVARTALDHQCTSGELFWNPEQSESSGPRIRRLIREFQPAVVLRDGNISTTSSRGSHRRVVCRRRGVRVAMWSASAGGHRRGEACWTSTQAHHQVEIVEVVWKLRTSPSLGWKITPVREVVWQMKTLPLSDQHYSIP